jgi:hypothetical protein
MKTRRTEGRTPRRISLAVARAMLVAGASSALGSCSLLYDLGGDQCNKDTDCAALGDLFEDKVCKEHVCVDPGGCKTNSDCIDHPETFGGTQFQGEPALCIKRQCVALKDPEVCPVILPIEDPKATDALRTENAIVLGGFAEIPESSLIGTATRNFDLALDELGNKIGGLPSAGGGSRPVVMVVCQAKTSDNAVLDRAMAHLADDLHVPGVVSALPPDRLQHVFETKGHEAGMFFISAQEADGTLTRLQDDNLIWSVLPGGNALGISYAPLLTRTLTYLNLSEPAKVATVVATDVRLLTDMVETAKKSPADGGLFYNELSLADNFNNDKYLEVQISSQSEAPEDTLLTEAQSVLAFLPHVIIAAADIEFLTKMIPVIERDWPTGTGQPKKPFYILSPYHFNATALLTLFDDLPAVRNRIVGLNAPAAADQTLYVDYRLAFQGYANDDWKPDFENYYDAVYYLLYAAAAGRGPVQSGSEFALGMPRLLSGQLAFGVGANDLDEAMPQVSLGSAITLNGTMGPPDFDPITGTRQAPASIWCVDSTRASRPDVLRYNTATKTLDGDFPTNCINGF